MFPNQDGQVLGPGRLLQIAREEKNLRPEDVAYEIRLTPSQVLALEENDYSKMPEETYVRGYLRNYARLVGIPENDILMAFARLTRRSEKKPQPVIPKGETEINKGGKVVRLLALFIIVAVIALSAVWVFEPYDRLSIKDEKAAAPVTEEKTAIAEIPLGVSTLKLDTPAESFEERQSSAESAALQPRAETTQESSALPLPEVISAQDAETVPASAEQAGSQIQSGIDSTPQAEETVELIITEAPATAAVAAGADDANQEIAGGEGSLFINYSKDSWTDVRDANGKKLLYRTVKKGEKIALVGKLPMSIFFGFAQGVNVTFNGTEIDVPSHTRGVFARFTVGEPENP